MATQIRKFNWADASDSDEDTNTTITSPTTQDAEVTKTFIKAADPSTPKAQKIATHIPSSARNTANADGGLSDGEGDSPALNAARELNYAEADVTPLRHFQEVTIQAAIPYKLKSVWNGPSSASPSVAAANVSPSLSPNAPPASAHTPITGMSPALVAAATPLTTRPLRMNRAVDELTTVLRQNGNSLPYDALMSQSQWRSRFQPSFGSLFTFLKRNRDIFHYKQSVVELVQEATIVSELLKINWATSKPTSGKQ